MKQTIVNDELKIFLHNVAWLRKHHSLSKKEMAERLGVGIKTLNKMEQGEIPPRLTADVFINIHRYFGIRPASQLEQRLG